MEEGPKRGSVDNEGRSSRVRGEGEGREGEDNKKRKDDLQEEIEEKGFSSGGEEALPFLLLHQNNKRIRST